MKETTVDGEGESGEKGEGATQNKTTTQSESLGEVQRARTAWTPLGCFEARGCWLLTLPLARSPSEGRGAREKTAMVHARNLQVPHRDAAWPEAAEPRRRLARKTLLQIAVHMLIACAGPELNENMQGSSRTSAEKPRTIDAAAAQIPQVVFASADFRSEMSVRGGNASRRHEPDETTRTVSQRCHWRSSYSWELHYKHVVLEGVLHRNKTGCRYMRDTGMVDESLEMRISGFLPNRYCTLLVDYHFPFTSHVHLILTSPSADDHIRLTHSMGVCLHTTT